MSEETQASNSREEDVSIPARAPVSWVTKDIGVDVDNISSLNAYASQINLLGLEERRIMMTITGPQKRLPYPTHIARNLHGAPVEIYDIPEDSRQQLLEKLFFLTNLPELDDKMWDIHEDKIFTVREFMVTREGVGNFLVCPAYLHSGGTLLDWMRPQDHPKYYVNFEQIKPGYMPDLSKVSPEDLQQQDDIGAPGSSPKTDDCSPE